MHDEAVYYDPALHKTLGSIVEMYDADAAANEQLAGYELRCPSTAVAPVFPNLKLVVKDKAHAARRFTMKRPWTADKYFEETFGLFVTKKNSITKMIQYSEVFKAWFVEFQTQDEAKITPVVRDMGFAGHRMDSAQKPLGRSVLNIKALISFAVKVMTVRPNGNVEVIAVKVWLLSVSDDDGERLTSAAALADIGDESIRFLRYCDNENMETERIDEECTAYLTKLKVLFIDGKAILHGYTGFMMKMLEKPFFYHADGRMHKIGCENGVPTRVLERLFQRSACVVRLITLGIQTEFPDFEILRAFSIFNLSQMSHDLVCYTSEQNEWFARLSQTFNWDVDDLKLQHKDHLPIAHHVYKAGCSNVEAWDKAIRDTSQRKSVADRHPSSTLKECVIKWKTLKSVTTGVEHSFARSTWADGKSRNLSCGAQMDTLTLVCDSDPAEDPIIIEGAQQLWMDYYGRVRTGKPKVQGFQSATRDAKRDAGTEIGWIRAKRQKVDDEANLSLHNDGKQTYKETRQNILELAAEVGKDQWSHEHDKEKLFQELRQKQRKIDGIAENSLLPGETSFELDVEAAAAVIKRKQNYEARERAEVRHSNVLTRLQMEALGLKGKKVNFADGLGNGANWDRTLRTFELVQAGGKYSFMYVCKDLENTGMRKWAAALRGGSICTPEYFLSGGKGGSAIAYNRMVAIEKLIYVTESFKTQYKNIFELLEIVMAETEGMKWKRITRDEFINKTAAQPRNLARFNALVSKEDIRTCEVSRGNNISLFLQALHTFRRAEKVI